MEFNKPILKWIVILLMPAYYMSLAQMLSAYTIIEVAKISCHDWLLDVMDIKLILSERFVHWFQQDVLSFRSNCVAFSVWQTKCWFLISECVNIQIYSETAISYMALFFWCFSLFNYFPFILGSSCLVLVLRCTFLLWKKREGSWLQTYFSTKTYVVRTKKNSLIETVLLSTRNIC